MSFWTQKKEPIFICLYFASHPPPFTHPPICQAEAIPSASGLLSLLTVKPQGSIWFCLSHMWVLRAVGVVECVGRRHCRAMVSPLSFLALLSQLWPAPSQPTWASSTYLSITFHVFHQILHAQKEIMIFPTPSSSTVSLDGPVTQSGMWETLLYKPVTLRPSKHPAIIWLIL